ncbi:MAG: transglutaminase-like domain-containing protein [Kaiparowitsia implicata GSE-PSE-MK54-09C]|jgi:regulator of sirC expression with transglutaminase-like and TPR domain|nr:transglutaminase-like domain-containing protein [Kaiparowitsia implicata GSE-PSE-MK54-09C]
MHLSQARLHFQQEAQRPDADIDLAKASLYLAQEEYPDLEPTEYLQQLDRMAAAVSAQLPSSRYPLRVIQTINEYLYDSLGFVGNADDYYDPRNSYLNQVLARQTGIPITLSLVYLELAQRIEFPMVGVGMPGHFLIRPVVDDMMVFVDPFHRGEVLFPEDCEARLQEVFGQPVGLRPEFLAPITSRQYLARMLTNLKLIYLNEQDLERTLAMVERLLVLSPDDVTERRDRGLIYYQLDRWREAVLDLEVYLDADAAAQDAAAIQQLVDQIKGHDPT